MAWRAWAKRIYALLRPGRRQERTGYLGARGQVTHVIILDGTMSSLEPGRESNAGLAYKLLREALHARMSLYYEAGVQWQDWRATGDVISGRGINRQIRRAYGYLASRYRSGDRIILMGYSRGAYAVRSLGGVIDRVGLLRARHATERNVLTAYRHYQAGAGSEAARAFTRTLCHDGAEIEMVGVWDSVKALGLRLPLMWRLTEPAHAFHDHHLGPSVRHGFHAPALDETRDAYAPVLWHTRENRGSHVEQVWFRGSHGDVGGQLHGFEAARPLANIPFRWMMERLAECGVALPEGWQARFPVDAGAPSCGTWRGWGRLFLLRHSRVVGRDPSERIHESVGRRQERVPDAAAAH
ncbi:MAG: DUF2235 domain-containing protein [Roseovarius sp.]|nr:DUF2235 domain-containing protein [Roseovarius sp.]